MNETIRCCTYMTMRDLSDTEVKASAAAKTRQKRMDWPRRL